jgi:LPXTG-motif cell wall-anchored protein
MVGVVIAAAAGIGLLGFYLYRRNKKTDKISTSQR